MIYRRIKFWDTVEGIEVVLDDELSKQLVLDDLLNSDSIFVRFLEMEGETLFYKVVLPKYLRVRPPDLRRFAYDHNKVKSLVINCVKDNSREYIFEPMNDSFLKNLQRDLFVALQDLNTILDHLSVVCSRMANGKPGDISARVEFEYKDGTPEDFVVHVNIEMV